MIRGPSEPIEEHQAFAARHASLSPPFNPLVDDMRQASAIDDPLEQRPVGGLGLRLIEGFTRDARYAYADGRNRLWLTLRSPDDSSAPTMDI